MSSKTFDEDHIANKLSLFFDRYKSKIITFPKEKGWMTDELYMYQGFWFQSARMFSIMTVMAAQDDFKPHPSDIYLATQPKCGTTWLKSLVFAIVNRNRYQNENHPLLSTNPHKLVPNIETEVVEKIPTYAEGHSPRLFFTHLPCISLPPSILDFGCRIVYMCRDPKDVLVSLFHFANKLRGTSTGPMTVEEAFEKFTKGITPHGPYWEHVKGYRKASLENPSKILFLTYENMKSDTENNVKNLADFLGYPFTEEENSRGVMEEIVSLCSFEKLSAANKHGDLGRGLPNSAFFRQGNVGDSINYLTPEMIQILDDITNKEFHGLDISF
uniref:cytosolic sulfotransferase 15-like n=1 Tax=Erigeron canadensis TaxID=72917 RepID=UPI001CB9982D|nr:cytosolic sulfotransferase 15-like [Erigeron canadensis]